MLSGFCNEIELEKPILKEVVCAFNRKKLQGGYNLSIFLNFKFFFY